MNKIILIMLLISTIFLVSVNASLTDNMMYYYPMDKIFCFDILSDNTIFFQIWDYNYNNKHICTYYYDFT